MSKNIGGRCPGQQRLSPYLAHDRIKSFQERGIHMTIHDYLDLKKTLSTSDDVSLSEEDAQAMRDSLIPPEYKIMDKMNEQFDCYQEQSQAQIKPLIALAETAKNQADAAWKQVEVMEKQLESMREQAETMRNELNFAKIQAAEAEKESRFAKILSIASFAVVLFEMILSNWDTIVRWFA